MLFGIGLVLIFDPITQENSVCKCITLARGMVIMGDGNDFLFHHSRDCRGFIL